MGSKAYQPKLTRDEMERRRLLAAKDLRGGMTQADVARKYGVSRASVCRWNGALATAGRKGLRKTKTPGRAPAFDAKARRELERILLLGAEHFGFEADLWTMPRLARVVRKEMGVVLDESNLRKTLVRLGYTWQRPERRARERDERKIKAWVKNDWPAIAKKGRKSDIASSSSTRPASA